MLCNKTGLHYFQYKSISQFNKKPIYLLQQKNPVIKALSDTSDGDVDKSSSRLKNNSSALSVIKICKSFFGKPSL